MVAALRDHGTRACYVFGPESGRGRGRGCRCEPCRQANRDYATLRDRQRVYPELYPGPDYVSAGDARAHLHALSSIGVGRRAVHAASGVAESSLERIAKGRARRIRRRTEERILAVSGLQRRPHALVDAGPVWELVEELLAVGVPKVRIAEAIGQHRALQLSRSKVTARNARSLQDLHDHAWRMIPALRELCQHEGAAAAEPVPFLA